MEWKEDKTDHWFLILREGEFIPERYKEEHENLFLYGKILLNKPFLTNEGYDSALAILTFEKISMEDLLSHMVSNNSSLDKILLEENNHYYLKLLPQRG